VHHLRHVRVGRSRAERTRYAADPCVWIEVLVVEIVGPRLVVSDPVLG
jgi:hypothetical protein